jgi:pyruvate formate lyase activating enzyme
MPLCYFVVKKNKPQRDTKYYTKDHKGFTKDLINMVALNKKTEAGKLECLLCPHFCKLAKDKIGICGVRKNTGEKIELLTYGIISGFALDPVEKKPFYHFFPGTRILSIGSWGCNMRCDFCQNYHISQSGPEKDQDHVSPSEIVKKALMAPDNIGIAFTYNEPVIWFEYVKDVAEPAKKEGLNTAMITNGFVAEKPLNEYLGFIDAFNVDLKAFNNDFYRKVTGADIEPVKQAIKMIGRAGKHLEITTLVIPGRNDLPSELENEVRWIASELGKDVPFHLSRYFPMYKRNDPVTPHEKLTELYEIACKHLDFVYLGNTMSDSGQDTICPRCKSVITKRSGYDIRHINTKDGSCLICGMMIYRNFTFSSSSKLR